MSGASLAGLPGALWGRVSSVIQESDGYSLPNQQRRAREVADELGVVVCAEDFEQGSGQDWDLAGLNRWLRAAKRGDVKVLILKNVSRLSRSRGKQAWLEHEAEQAGLILHYYDEAYDDNAAGRLQRGIMAEVAEFQLEQAREDSMAARYEKVEQFGRPVGNGPLPYGWARIVDRSGAKPRTVGYEHDPEQVAVIHRFRALRTMSTRELADQLNAEGVSPPAAFRPSEKRPCAGRWEPYTIRHILQNRMLWGEYRYGERERYRVDGKWRQRQKQAPKVVSLQLPPILERAEAEELLAIVSGRHRRYTTGWRDEQRDGDPFVLRGMLVCGLCGSVLRTLTAGGKSRTGGKDRYYRCPRTNRRLAERQGQPVCTLPPVTADRARRGAAGPGIEDVVWEAIDAFFADEAAVRAVFRRAREQDDSADVHAARLAFLRHGIVGRREAHQRATDRWSEASDPLDRDSFEATRARLAGEIASFERELRQLEQVVPRAIGVSEETAVLALGRRLRAGLVGASPAARQAGGVMLGLQVTVTPATDGAFAVGRHRYELDGRALGQRLRSSEDDNLTKLSLQLLCSEPTVSLALAI